MDRGFGGVKPNLVLVGVKPNVVLADASIHSPESGGMCVSGKISGYCEAVHTGLQHMNQGSTRVEVQHMGTSLEQASHIWGSYTIFSGV